MTDIPQNTPPQPPDPLAQLLQLESRITLARKAGIEIGRALGEIKAQELFRTTGGADFDVYALNRWGYKRAYARRLIQAAHILDQIANECRSTHLDLAGKLMLWGNVSAALALGDERVAEKRIEVVAAAFALDPSGQPTKTHVRAAIAKVLQLRTIDASDRRTSRVGEAVSKLKGVIRHVRDKHQEIDRVAVASLLEDVLSAIRERHPKAAKAEGHPA